MSQPIDKGWIALSVTKFVSIVLAFFAVMLLVWAINLFHEANQYAISASANQNAAEDQPHGLDALGAIFGAGIGLVVLTASVVLFIVALVMFLITSIKLKKKADLAQRLLQNQGQVVTSNTQPPMTSQQVPQQDNKVNTVASGKEASDNNPQQGVQ
jgi:hypothetical protein